MENNVNQNTYISVITSAATVAASRVEGVASITNESGFITEKLNIKNMNKGVNVEINSSNQVILDISINVMYGYKVPELVCRVQEVVKEEIETTTSYKVKSINVNVVGVIIPS